MKQERVGRAAARLCHGTFHDSTFNISRLADILAASPPIGHHTKSPSSPPPPRWAAGPLGAASALMIEPSFPRGATCHRSSERRGVYLSPRSPDAKSFVSFGTLIMPRTM